MSSAAIFILCFKGQQLIIIMFMHKTEWCYATRVFIKDLISRAPDKKGS